MNKMNRRGFFAMSAKVAGLALLAPATLKVMVSEAQAEQKRGARGGGAAAGGGLPLVDANDSVAKAVRYVEDAKKAPDAKGNNCINCGFYKKVEMRNGKEVGTCTIFAGKVVYGEGWCGSWNKKA
ncbi:MAG: high-potential iron-sulfur protein [Bdellovibrionia bacterium]